MPSIHVLLLLWTVSDSTANNLSSLSTCTWYFVKYWYAFVHFKGANNQLELLFWWWGSSQITHIGHSLLNIHNEVKSCRSQLQLITWVPFLRHVEFMSLILTLFSCRSHYLYFHFTPQNAEARMNELLTDTHVLTKTQRHKSKWTHGWFVWKRCLQIILLYLWFHAFNILTLKFNPSL